MAYTFGAATSDRIVFNPPNSMGGFGTFVWGWWLPTTLTAGRRFWGSGQANGAEIDTTTSQMRLKRTRATTNDEWTTSDAGLAVNKASFLAWLYSGDTTSTFTWRAWAGSLDVPPIELTITSAVTGSGGTTDNAAIQICNTIGNNVSFQGDLLEFGHISAPGAGTRPPLFLNALGTISNDEADLVYRRLVLPAWKDELVPPGAINATSTIAYGFTHIRPDLLPVGMNQQSSDATTAPPLALTITGATISANGPMRGYRRPALLPRRVRL